MLGLEFYEIMTRCNLEENPVQKSTHGELHSHNFMTSVGYSKMGIYVVLSFVVVSLKHVFMAIQLNNK